MRLQRRYRQKSLIPYFEELTRRFMCLLLGYRDRFPVEPLNRVHERWTIVLFKNIPPHFKNIIGTYPYKVAIEGCVVQLAQ